MPAAVAIPAIIGAAGSVGGALIQRHAANSATQAQTDASDKALNLQRDIYTQQRNDLAPYREGGAGAMSLLNLGLGITPQGTATVPGLTSDGPHTSARGPNGEPGQVAQRNPNAQTTTFVPATAYTGDTAVPRGLASLGQSPAQAQTSSSYVTMRAPDGATRQVPANQVGFYQAKGAEVVGG